MARMASSSITAAMALANEGDALYCTTDNLADCTLTAGTAAPVGMITEYISASSVWVRLNEIPLIAG